MIGAMAIDGIRSMMTIDSGTNIDVFVAFVSQVLIPNLRVGDIVVMDNLSVHKNAKIRKLIEAAHCQVLFIPPYSPEFNPIEECWAKLKDILRRCETRTREAFDNAVKKAIESITTKDITAWVTFAGYTSSV